jgi:hypothetical protein
MPPKKDKKTKAKKAKKMRLSIMEPSPKFATGFNRLIPGGVIGTSGGGGYVPASFAVGGYASRPAPASTPLVAGDQIQLQRNLTNQAIGIESIIQEQKALRKERSDKGKKRGPQPGPEQPTQPQTPMNVKLEEPSQSVSMADALEAMMGGGASDAVSTNIRLTKKGTPDKRYKMTPPSGAPPVIGTGEQFEGGDPERQQGLAFSVPGRLRTPAPDASQSLVGLDGIGEAGKVIPPPTTGLQNQGVQGGM